MGRLLYGAPASSHSFEDRALAHLQTVITSRFRRGEGFLLTIEDAEGRRSELWLHPGIPTRYEYDGTAAIELNPHWLRELSNASNGRLGLHLLPETSSPDDLSVKKIPA
ncbi:hypothetical protein C5C36_12960 [Rathayibacter sp. AY1G1]|jgi:hypothetical protein|uniref:DUF7882 family protein n=1 Tax=unclassified Rathayibacter TaxID=2609250 RepID=UPI000CE8A72E|nr:MULTISPECIES: hypothetical protein [unclassified Rathayibacter]PPF10292.1 hypothetical protein C5B98_12565 [Rathayibacter sp. AY1A5]PPF17099.1 hypothetical protein C5B92_09760 [Rathayibacter sp. AY1A4]PPF18722.1 hypothetical protein C5B95_11080 [Rathayibacter sp. AY1A7]PPF26779.1 hypothetical protein C5C54_12230 [Rathayibacter sp. AY1F2]PPF35056.1 hypothetical protein C5B93_11535 [Rathayibacter sp. AY1A2]